jgi:threonine/homoserine/homoserine lactone efflux protein
MTPLLLASLPFFWFFFVASITPGPNNFMLAASGMNFGYKRTLPHIAGVAVGFCSLMLLCMMGVGAVFVAFPALQFALKILAAAYLLYLAFLMAREALLPPAADAAPEGGRKRPMTFTEAALFQYINPKGWMMGVSSTATFLPAGADAPEKAAVIILAVILIGVPCIIVWTMFGKAMAVLFTSDKYRRFINLTLALLLVLTIPMMLA